MLRLAILTASCLLFASVASAEKVVIDAPQQMGTFDLQGLNGQLKEIVDKEAEAAANSRAQVGSRHMLAEDLKKSQASNFRDIKGYVSHVKSFVRDVRATYPNVPIQAWDRNRISFRNGTLNVPKWAK